MLRSPTVELIVGLILPFVALVLVDLLLIPLGDSDIVSVVAGAVWLMTVVAAPVLFFRFFRHVLHRSDVRPGLAVFCTVISLPLWLYVAMTLFGNIHLALGGSL